MLPSVSRFRSDGLLRDVEVNLAVRNLFNTAPPDTIATTQPYGASYDTANDFPFGRVVSFAVVKPP